MKPDLGLSYAKLRLGLDEIVFQPWVGLDGLKYEVLKNIFSCHYSYDNILFG